MSKDVETVLDTSKELRSKDEFCFSCVPDKDCFTQCCYDLTLMLMPYDIYRLKKALGMSSKEFLERYTSVHVGPGTGIPVVTVKMEGPYLKCPFLEEGKGCTVYNDRPGACRAYPLARIAQRSHETGEIDEYYYVVRESDCRGFKDCKSWTVEEWVQHEGLSEYNEFNDLFSELIHAKNKSGVGQLNADQIEMFYMGCYDIDSFREFFLEGPNLDRYMEDEATIQKLQEDELELLKYGIRWVKKKLFEGGSCIACGLS
ncbi:hypothetical protein DBT_1378 [Dissulfuribacter thermophilus]|uniref:YkgJ family cysteine cluster protein n=1 Tax=Dissulfuribacter thermophilus TaxID=1156395 RepID=A0A1B9F615_9BACT|nr:YkgJ family cysteine cluster protein [Dissulfuribacter thermophilus]OCC15255.1 hypothetical protein DBT_1378 [Dissulfuribacter thermophilus]